MTEMPFKEWLKGQEPQYHEDLTLSEQSFYETIYRMVVMTEVETQLTDCDMHDTDLCKHYQKRYACMYGFSHNVKHCPYGQLDYYKRD